MPNIEKKALAVMGKKYFSFPDVVTDAATLTDEQWKEQRRQGIGGSEAAICTNESKYETSQRELYFEKIGAEVKLTRDDSSWFFFKRGHALEDLVAEMFARKTGFQVLIDTNFYRHPVHTFMQGNIDRVCILPDGTVAGLECKTSTPWAMDEWKNGKVPRAYLRQCQHYMAITDCDVWYIACLWGTGPQDFTAVRIDRDKEDEQRLIEAERVVWQDYVLSGIEPPMVGTPDDEIWVTRRFTGAADKALPALVLEAELQTELEEWEALARDKQALKKQTEGIEDAMGAIAARITAGMENATKAALSLSDDELFEVSWSPRSRTSTDTDKLQHSFPEAYAACVTVNPESSRVFAVKRKQIKKKQTEKKKDEKAG